MGHAILAFDGPDPGRRAATRPRHLSVLGDWVADGRVRFAVPLLDAAGTAIGSLIVLAAAERRGVDGYLAAEPFAAEGVWAEIHVHRFRIAPLPYPPLPQPGAPVAPRRTHTVVVAWDGPDPSRRSAARAAHLARVGPEAAAGRLAFGGALLAEDGATMRGSIAVTAHPDDAAARDWLAADPYVADAVWRDIALHGTRFFPLPFHPLPGAAA